jgi:thioredoxin 1
MSSEKIRILTNDNFDNEVSAGVSLVDFWADWCGPCKMVAPVMEELAVEYEGKAKICKVDVDEQQELGNRFKVRSIPTVLVMKNGVEVGRLVGVQSKAHYADELKKII